MEVCVSLACLTRVSCAACTMINPAGEAACIVCASLPPSEPIALEPTEAGLFKSRVFCVVAPHGIAYRDSPHWDTRLEHVHML